MESDSDEQLHEFNAKTNTVKNKKLQRQLAISQGIRDLYLPIGCSSNQVRKKMKKKHFGSIKAAVYIDECIIDK